MPSSSPAIDEAVLRRALGAMGYADVSPSELSRVAERLLAMEERDSHFEENNEDDDSNGEHDEVEATGEDMYSNGDLPLQGGGATKNGATAAAMGEILDTMGTAMKLTKMQQEAAEEKRQQEEEEEERKVAEAAQLLSGRGGFGLNTSSYFAAPPPIPSGAQQQVAKKRVRRGGEEKGEVTVESDRTAEQKRSTQKKPTKSKVTTQTSSREWDNAVMVNREGADATKRKAPSSSQRLTVSASSSSAKPTPLPAKKSTASKKHVDPAHNALQKTFDEEEFSPLLNTKGEYRHQRRFKPYIGLEKRLGALEAFEEELEMQRKALAKLRGSEGGDHRYAGEESQQERSGVHQQRASSSTALRGKAKITFTDDVPLSKKGTARYHDPFASEEREADEESISGRGMVRDGYVRARPGNQRPSSAAVATRRLHQSRDDDLDRPRTHPYHSRYESAPARVSRHITTSNKVMRAASSSSAVVRSKLHPPPPPRVGLGGVEEEEGLLPHGDIRNHDSRLVPHPFLSRHASSVIYSYTDNVRYRDASMPTGGGVFHVPKRKVTDVVSRGREMREKWAKDSFLTQKGRKDERWDVRRSMISIPPN